MQCEFSCLEHFHRTYLCDTRSGLSQLPITSPGAADSVGGGGGEGCSLLPAVLAKSRRGKTLFLSLHLPHSACWPSYNWVFLKQN